MKTTLAAAVAALMLVTLVPVASAETCSPAGGPTVALPVPTAGFTVCAGIDAHGTSASVPGCTSSCTYTTAPSVEGEGRANVPMTTVGMRGRVVQSITPAPGTSWALTSGTGACDAAQGSDFLGLGWKCTASGSTWTGTGITPGTVCGVLTVTAYDILDLPVTGQPVIVNQVSESANLVC